MHPGPDFRQASLAIGDAPRQRGDVELHRFASGWTAHRHHLDPRYDDVILHVFLWNDRKDETVAAARMGSPSPRWPWRTSCPARCWPTAPTWCWKTTRGATCRRRDAATRRCAASGRTRCALLLDRAGDVRLRQRMWRWTVRYSEAGAPQAAYEAVMRALGSTGHRQHFQELARLVPWPEARDCLAGAAAAERRVAAEGLLLGLAGLLPSGDPDTGFDDDTRRYVEHLYAHWDAFPAAVRRRAWHGVNWRQPNVRPANSPERRLAGMACLLAGLHGAGFVDAGVRLIREAAADGKPRDRCRALAALFACGGPSYWSRRTRFGSRPVRPQHLIGAGRALTVVVDALLPLLSLDAQRRGDAALRDAVLSCYQAAPRLPDNHALRYMARRLLGDDAALLPLVQGARQQQGLLQVLTDHCGNDEGDCRGCDFPLGL